VEDLMERFIVACLRVRTFIISAAAVLLVGGIWQLRSMPIDVVPEFSPVTLQVRTEALGLSAAEVESLITVPLEADLLIGVPWLKSIDSESVSGVSSIDLLFEPGTDLMRARQMVNERMTQARALPNVSSPPTLLLPVATANRVLNIGMSSTSVSLIDMSVQAQWTVVPRLIGLPGVSNVTIWGQRNRQFQVQVDPTRLHDRGVTLDQVVKTAGEAVWASPLTYLNSSTPGTGGFIDTPNQRLNVRHVFPITAAKDFANIPVAGTSLALHEVADVVEGHQPLIGDALLKDGPGLLLVVEKYPGFNTVTVTKAVEAALDELRPGLTGIDIDTTIYRPAGFIERATANLSHAVIAAAILAVVGLALLLGSWRATISAIAAVALSMTAAVLVFFILGLDFNMMVISGLLMAVAVVVDDAVVASYAIQARLRADNGAAGPAWRVIAGASGAALGPMVYAALILIVAAAPLLLTQGNSAAFFQPLAWSYIVAVVVSLLVAAVITPTIASILVSPTASNVVPAPAGPIGRLYERVTERAAASWWPATALVVCGVLLAAVFWTQPDRSVIPSFKETDLFVEVQAQAGTSLPAMEAATDALMRKLRAVAGVRDSAAQIGRAALARDVTNVDAATIWLSLDPDADYARTLSAIQKTVETVHEFDASVQTFLSKRMRESLTGEDQAISVRIYGQDLRILRAKAQEIQQTLAKIDGIKDPQIEPQSEQQAIEVEVNLDKARVHGLKPGDVRRAASALIGGITVGSLFQDQKVFDVVIWGHPSIRRNLEDIRNLSIDTEAGDQVRLADVARVDVVSTPSVIHRQGASRRIDVEAEVSGRSLAAVTKEVKERIKEGAYPFEYHAEVLGEHVERQSALRSLYGYVIAACIAILLLLQAALNSWRLAALVAAAVFVATLGGVITTLIVGGGLTLGAFLGLGTVAGLTLRSALMQIRYFQMLEQQVVPSRNWVPAGAREQLPVIFASAVTVALIALPFVVLGDVAGLETFHPAAAVILGGLITSTLVTALLIPPLYSRLTMHVLPKSAAIRPEVV